MNIDLMRAIDKLVGIPLSCLLTIIVKSIGIITRFKPSQTIKKILFIELSEMGSTILADPAIRKARNMLGAELLFVIFKKNSASLELTGTIPADNIFTIRENNIYQLMIDTLKFLIWTRQNKIDTVVDLELFSRFTALLSGLCGASKRVGFYRFHNEGLYRGEMLTHKVSYNPHIHIAKNFIALINSLLVDTTEIPYSKQIIADHEIRLPVKTYPQAELDSMNNLVSQYCSRYKSGKHKIVLINPNASELLPQRRWLKSRYIQLIDKVLAKHDDVVILITGAASEKEEAAAMCKEIGDPRCVNFAGALKLVKLPVLYSIATLMVTNDSGPGHFSSITKMPTFILFGPETPKLYGSLGNATPLYAKLACSPCVSAANHRKTPCRDNKCLQAISVEQVYAAIKPVL